MPVGTILSDAETGEVLFELLVPGEMTLIAKGGEGGFGNMRFKSSINRAPRQKTPGKEGERIALPLASDGVLADGVLGASDYRHPYLEGPFEMITENEVWEAVAN